MAFSDRGGNGAGCGGADATQTHELLGLFILLGKMGNMFVIFADTRIELGELAQGVTDDGVAPAWQIFQVFVGFATDHSGFEGQHDTQLRQEATDAVDQRGAVLYIPLARGARTGVIAARCF